MQEKKEARITPHSGAAMIALGDLARGIALALRHRAPEIGRGQRINLLLPASFGCDCERPEILEVWLQPTSFAPPLEVLRLDCHNLEGPLALSEIFDFLLGLLVPPFVGCGETYAVLKELDKEVIVVRENIDHDGRSLGSQTKLFPQVSHGSLGASSSPSSASRSSDQAALPASGEARHLPSDRAAGVQALGLASVEITPEMIKAGAAVLDLWAASSPSRLELIAGEVYAAMAACAVQQPSPKRRRRSARARACRP